MEIYEIGKAYKVSDSVMRIDIDSEYADALGGIGNLKRIYVLYWMHKLDETDRKKLRVHPQGNINKPLTGVFALRSPMRPNPIGLSLVQLVERKGNNLYVKGLDAMDGTPIIDIKSR